MENDCNKTIDDAINKMAEQTKVQVDPNKALHFSQSALNLANAKATLLGCKTDASKKTS